MPSDPVSDLGNKTGTFAIPLVGNVYTFAATDNVTLTFPTPVSGVMNSFIIEFTIAAGKTITFPGTVEWNYGTTPTISSSNTNRCAFDTIDYGTSWRGYYSRFA